MGANDARLQRTRRAVQRRRGPGGVRASASELTAALATGDAIAAVIRHRAATVAGLKWSEREDLNLRPLVSQDGFLIRHFIKLSIT